MLNRINLSEIRSFVLIARLGSFTKAAEVLCVSRSHISKQLSALEATLNITLVQRTTRTLRLTDAGKQLYQQCDMALNDIDQAIISTLDDKTSMAGPICINSVGGFIGEELVMPMVSEFLQLYPDISISVDFSSHRVDLIEDEFDIAFRMGELPDAGFVARHLLNIQTLTLASPSYLDSQPQFTHPLQLKDSDCLIGSVTQWHFIDKNGIEKDLVVPVAGRLLCKNGRGLIRSALDGNGIIRVPRMYCEAEILAGTLKPVFESWRVPEVPFNLIYHKDKYQPNRLRTLISFMQTRFAAKVAGGLR